MNTLTLHQPYASLIAHLLKPIETRTHNRFHGLVGKTIAIHAAQKWDQYAFTISWPLTLGEMARQAAADYGADETALLEAIRHARAFPGCVVAVADVKAHRLLTEADSAAALCPAAGLYGLVLDNVRRFREPIPTPPTIPPTSHRGIWQWEPPSNWEELTAPWPPEPESSGPRREVPMRWVTD